MDPTHYYSLPEAKLLLDHLHKINPKYGIEIVENTNDNYSSSDHSKKESLHIILSKHLMQF